MIVKCREYAEKIKSEARKLAYEYLNKHHRPIKLAVIMAGNNPASQIYVRNKQRVCAEVGIEAHTIIMTDEHPTTEQLVDIINQCNADDNIQGIMVQLPLPNTIDASVIHNIAPTKDVECMCYDNIGKLSTGLEVVAPCTPLGIMYMLQDMKVPLRGANVVIIGRSDIVGKPMAMMLINAGATVTVCNSATKKLSDYTNNADIVIVAAGVPKLIGAEDVKYGSILIDVGINRTEHGLCGDIDTQKVANIAKIVTDVPGGVGLLTTAALALCTARKACE